MYNEKQLLDLYNEIALGHTDAEALDIFTEAINTMNIKSVNMHEVIARHLYSDKFFYFDALLTDIFGDSQYNIDQKLLTDIKVDDNGDLNHSSLKNKNFGFKGLFKKIGSKVEDGALYLRFMVNKDHNDFNTFIDSLKDKEIQDLKMSAEFYNAVQEDDKIVSADGIGWSVLIDEQPGNCNVEIFDMGEMK